MLEAPLMHRTSAFNGRSSAIFLGAFCLVGCFAPNPPPAPPTPAGMYRVDDAFLVFTPPDAWNPMQEQLWKSRDFSAGFQLGTDPDVPSSYFLVKAKRQRKWSDRRMKSTISNAVPIDDLGELAEIISQKTYGKTIEYYSAERDTFFFIEEYPDSGSTSITVMAKRFCQYHYVVFHFYLRGEMNDDIAALTSTIDSVMYDDWCDGAGK